MQVESVSVIAVHVVYNKRYVFTSNCSKEKDMLKFYGSKVARSSESKVERLYGCTSLTHC